MKQAWEAAEPGRAIKAAQERIRYINECVKKSLMEAETENASPTAGSREAAFPPVTEAGLAIQRKEWTPIDLAPYIKKTLAVPILKNETTIQQQEMRKTEEINKFRYFRELILEHRQQERTSRNQLKQNVLEMYEDLQVSLDEARSRIFGIRDTYRGKLLEAERLRLEALAAEEAAIRAEQEKKSPDVQKKKAGKPGGKKK
ncbi:hypothetical protein E2320_019137 [Naja naja]|nr:hypothetical protein E2320_019137 [Naja naja]